MYLATSQILPQLPGLITTAIGGGAVVKLIEMWRSRKERGDTKEDAVAKVLKESLADQRAAYAAEMERERAECREEMKKLERRMARLEERLDEERNQQMELRHEMANRLNLVTLQKRELELKVEQLMRENTHLAGQVEQLTQRLSRMPEHP